MLRVEKREGILLSPEAAEALKNAGPKCTKCIKSRVCFIYLEQILLAKRFENQTLTDIVKEGEEKLKAPFKPEDFAVICEEYQSGEGA